MMENPEEVLHSLEEFSKSKSKDIPPELEEYLCFVAKTGDPVYQWPAIKSLFREKMISVISDFYETCPSVEIPPCPNVDLFNYDVMKTFILEKLDTFAAAPFTLQRMCELLTTPRKEYNRIDKYMRALEKNILVVSTTEPGGRRSTENGEGIMNGLESEHLPETSNSSNDINVEEMDDAPSWPRLLQTESIPFQNTDNSDTTKKIQPEIIQEASVSPSKLTEAASSSTQDTVITCRSSEEPYVCIEPVPSNTCVRENVEESDVSVTITAIPAGVQKRRNSVEPVVSPESTEQVAEPCTSEASEKPNEEAPAEEEAVEQPKKEETPSEQIKDVDSSSNIEESAISTDDKLPDTSSVSSPETPTADKSASDEPLLTPTQKLADILINETNEVETSADIEEDKVPVAVAVTETTNSETVVASTSSDNECSSEENSNDATKCSDVTPQEESSSEAQQTEASVEERETIITSSDKSDNEAESSDLKSTTITLNSLESDSSNEAVSSNEDVTSQPDVSSNANVENVTVDKEEDASSSSSTPMEVDDDFSNSSSEKVEEVVKAEATSDSLL